MSNDIFVVGYPRSGNTYTARLLGDILNSPVEGMGSAHPLAEEGKDRPGEYVVRQLHLRIDYDTQGDALVPSPWLLNPKNWKMGDKIVFVVRDPRDVAVSAWMYWDIPSLTETIGRMGEAKHPLKVHGPWQRFVGDWIAAPLCYTLVHYEVLVDDPCHELRWILQRLCIPSPDHAKICETVDRQSIEARRKEIAAAPDGKYMYGTSIQLKHLRKGIAGDWRNHFSREQNELAYGYFGEVMETLGYGKW